jgi:hypothetical protein
MEIYASEPLVSEPSPFDVEIAIAKLKRHKSPGTDQIQTELIQAGGKILRFAIHKFVSCTWNKEEWSQQWKDSVVVPVNKKGDKTDCINNRCISLLLMSYKVLSNILLSRLSPYVEGVTGIISVEFDVIDQQLIRLFAFVICWRNNGSKLYSTSDIHIL